MLEKTCLTAGRFFFFFYFLGPGIIKIPRYEYMIEYMTLHNIPLVNITLPLATFLEILCGLMLITGFRIKESALILASLTLLINIGVHDFWNDYPNTDTTHEIQNFLKNLGIFAGLLVVSTSHQMSQWRLFNKK